MILVAFILSLLLSFLFSGLESALVAVSRVRVKHAAEKGDPQAVQLLSLLKIRDSLLGTVTVANHVVNVAAFGMIVWKLVSWVGPWGYGVSFLLALPLFVIGLEVVPKTLFRRFPFRSLRRFIPLLRVLGLLARPLAALRPSWTADESPSSADQRADLLQLLHQMVEKQVMPAATAHLMERILQLRGHTVASLMQPLAEDSVISEDTPLQKAKALSQQIGTPVLLLRSMKGTLSGLLDVTKLESVVPADRLARQYARPLERLAPSTSAIAALQRLRRRGQSCALVESTSSTGPSLYFITEEDLLGPLIG